MANSENFQYEYFSSVTQRKIEWLWYPYIPYGKITILQGDPGEGKSTFILNIAALLSRGKNMPDGYKISEPQQVIYQTAEDNIADTIKPRLVAAGADCNRIAYIIDNDNRLTLEDERIESVIKETRARLFILDPLQAYLSQDSDMFSVGKIRHQLKNLSDIAARNKCAIVIIGHMNKASGEKNLYRGLGSIDIAAIARSVLMISRDKDDASIRYMFPVKSSLAAEGQAISFRFNHRNSLTWTGNCMVNKEQIEQYKIDKNKRSLARRILLEILVEQDIESTEIQEKLQYMGVSERTINSAKKELGIESYRKNKIWYWHLPSNVQEVKSYGSTSF